MERGGKGFAMTLSVIDINRTVKGLILAAFISGTFPLEAFAQQEQPSSIFEDQTERGILSTIAPYNEDVRERILVASQHPEVLSKLGNIRDQASQHFQQTISYYSQKKQKWFYDVSRFPQLMHALAIEPKGSSKERINTMVKEEGAELQEAAWRLYRHEHRTLVSVDAMNQQAERAFEELISGLDRNTQDAFYKLLDSPDVLSLLNEHMDLTERLGQKFRANPDETRQALATEHDRLETENRDELAAYKDDMMKDPQAMEDLRKASEEYARETGYSYPAPAADTVINSYAYSPYSYWFGYPYWFGSPMWYPGMRYGSGFYLGFGGASMIYGLPSYGFSAWFFGGAYMYYPHLYRSYNHVYRENGRNVVAGRSNTGFMRAANQHFNPAYSSRSSRLTTPNGSRAIGSNGVYNGYRQSMQRQTYSRSYTPNSSRTPAYGGASRGSFGGGMSSRGGGFSGGGMRGGGRR